jgi:predicted HTH transcriptional regulator
MELPKTVEDIQKLIGTQVQESLNLDYKRSSSISNKARAEIAKDASAFANSDGGLIIYGVEEK